MASARIAQKSEARWGQVAKTPSKGANRPEACAKVQRLSQISEYGVQYRVQSTDYGVRNRGLGRSEMRGIQGDTGACGRRNRGAEGQGLRAQVNRAGWVHGYSWHAKPAHHPSPPSIQTPVAHSSAPDVVITLRVISKPNQWPEHLSRAKTRRQRTTRGMTHDFGTHTPRRLLSSSFMARVSPVP